MEQPQEVEDEEHERVWERVAAVDVAKASGVVCTRVPGDGPSGRRSMPAKGCDFRSAKGNAVRLVGAGQQVRAG